MADLVNQFKIEDLKDTIELIQDVLELAEQEGLTETIDFNLFRRRVLEQHNELSNMNIGNSDNIQAMTKAVAFVYRMREQIKEGYQEEHGLELWTEAKNKVKKEHGPELWAEAKDEVKEDNEPELMEEAKVELKDENFDILWAENKSEMRDEYEEELKEEVRGERVWKAERRYFLNRVVTQSSNAADDVVNENADKSILDSRKRSRSVAESPSTDSALQQVSAAPRPVVKKRKIVE